MKNILLLVVVVTVLVIGFFALKKDNTVVPSDEMSSIKGCYVAGTERDVYTLSIDTHTDSMVSGRLSFKNYQKDSSSGDVVGAYQNGILLANYSFQSEGMDSIMQVIFKRQGTDFVRGYGPMNTDGTKFVNTSEVIYDSSSPLNLFKKTPCV